LNDLIGSFADGRRDKSELEYVMTGNVTDDRLKLITANPPAREI
jgi:hypothetical protein